MASITYNGVVSEARGSIGNTTYSRNRYGAYVKVKPTPTNPNTARQIDWRTRMANAVSAWQALTDAERNLFIKQASEFTVHDRLGRVVKITGYNLFIRQQLLASKSGSLPLVGSPFAKLTDIFQMISIELSTTEFIINVFSNNVPAECQMTIKASASRSSGKPSFNPSTCIIITEATSPGTGSQAIDITTDYEAVHGAIAGIAGDYVTIGIQTFNPITGERSEDYFLSQIVSV
jgi:hypothetical protein